MKTLTLYTEKRDLEAIKRFFNNLQSNEVMESGGWFKIQPNFWMEAQKIEVNYEKTS